MVISKGSYGNGESKNVLPKSVQIAYLPLRGSKVPCFMGGSIRTRMEICETLALPINPHGTAFAPKQWLYQKEATGMES